MLERLFSDASPEVVRVLDAALEGREVTREDAATLLRAILSSNEGGGNCFGPPIAMCPGNGAVVMMVVPTGRSSGCAAG